MHQMLIQSLSFSNDEQYLASLGGQDDGQLVIWEVSYARAIRHRRYNELFMPQNNTQLMNLLVNCVVLERNWQGHLWTLSRHARS